MEKAEIEERPTLNYEEVTDNLVRVYKESECNLMRLWLDTTSSDEIVDKMDRIRTILYDVGEVLNREIIMPVKMDPWRNRN